MRLLFIALMPIFSLCSVVPQTFNKVKEAQKPNAKHSPEEILSCMKLFKLNKIDLNDMYNDFIRSKPGSGIWDFYEHMYEAAVGISVQSSLRDRDSKQATFYHVLQISSSDRKLLEGAKTQNPETELAYYCMSNSLAVRPKVLTKEAVLNIFPSDKIGQFSVIYRSNGVCRIYYILNVVQLAEDYLKYLNLGTYNTNKMIRSVSTRYAY